MTDISKKTFAEVAELAPKHDPAACTREGCRRCDDHAPTAPPVNPDQHDAVRVVPAPDPVVRNIGLARHPEPSAIADALEAAAKTLRSHGVNAIHMASQLAARGYSASTLGDGGSRPTDSTSVPERSAYRPGTTDKGKPIPPPPGARWWGADEHYARLLADSWRFALKAKATTDEILRHASDVDPLPAGTGACRACNRVCRPDAQRPDNRIKSGLCPTCYKAWQRYSADDGPMLWSEWVAKRREGYSERDGEGRLITIHTPEPDHDLDRTG